MSKDTTPRSASTADSAQPDLADALARIDARLARIERSVDGVGELAATTPATIATVTDTVDTAIDQLQRRGVDVDERLHKLLHLTERLTDPETLDALENGLETVRSLPALVATIGDVFDGTVARLHEAGIDVDERLQVVAQVAERLTAPEALAAVNEMLSHIGAIQRLLGSGIFAPGAVDVVDRAAGALADMDVAGARPIGPFGALRALNDPCMKRALGALVEFGKRFGRTVHTRTDRDAEPSPCADRP